MSSLLFRCDADSRIGFGHLRRCIVLANECAARGHEVAFVLGGDAAARRLTESAGYKTIPSAVGADPARLPEDTLAAADAIVMDQTHSLVLGAPEQALDYILALRRHAPLAVIDGLPPCLSTVIPDLACDLYIAPYAGAASTGLATRDSLVGPRYFILDPVFACPGPPRVASLPDRVLITCGGSDPTGVTLLALMGLERATARPLSVDVVEGPGFSQELCRSVDDLVASSRHAIARHVSPSPDALAGLMRVNDIAIATSGLTKYELCAMRVPAILVSIDRHHLQANEGFSRLRCAVDLGLASDLSAERMGRVVLDLLNDPARLEELSRSCADVLDGRGVVRTVDRLEEFLSA